MRSPERDRRPVRYRLAAALAVALIGPARGDAVQAADTPRAFRAGAATTNISPWLGLSINGNMRDGKVAQVHDELHARALVLDDGKTRLAFVVCDSCMIPREVVTAAKERVKASTGIAPDHVLVSATHAHSCPTAGAVFQSEPDATYLEFLTVRIADAVKSAVNNLAPARVGWGVGRNTDHVFNRRWKMKPGTVPPDPFGRADDRVKMNPPAGSPNLIEPAGPTDPEVSVVFVASPEGRPVALLANYSLHYVGGVGSGHASADYFGAFADRVERALAPGTPHPDPKRPDAPFVAIMSNGTSGDINNVNYAVAARPAMPPYGRIRLVADALAGEAVRVARSFTLRDDVTLDARAEDLKLDTRRPDDDDLARAADVVVNAKGAEMNGLEEVYARETVIMRKFPKQVDATIQAFRIGELGVVAIPCEVFAEIGLEIKAKSPLRPAFTVELANGYNGYLPTRAQHALGGYETWRARSSYLEVDSAERITAKVFELLDALHKAAPSGKNP